jgi:hypothetical protein
MEEIMVEAHQPLTAAQGKAGKEGKKGAGKGSKKKPANSTPLRKTGKD